MNSNDGSEAARKALKFMETGQLRLRMRGAMQVGIAYFLGQVVGLILTLAWLLGSSIWQLRRALVGIFSGPEVYIGSGLVSLAFILGWILVAREIRHPRHCFLAALLSALFATGSAWLIADYFPPSAGTTADWMIMAEDLYWMVLPIFLGLGIRWLGAWSRSIPAP